MQMDPVSGRNLQGGGIDLDEAVCVEPSPDEAGDARAGQEAAPALSVAPATPEWRGGGRNSRDLGSS